MKVLNRHKCPMTTPSGEQIASGGVADLDRAFVVRQNTTIIRPLDDWCQDVRRGRKGWLIAECRRFDLDESGDEDSLRNRLLDMVGRGTSPQQAWADLWSEATQIAKELNVELESRSKDYLEEFIEQHKGQVAA